MPRVVMYQKWRDLLFLHWRMDPAAIQQTLPPDLTVDTWENAAWIGVVPFRMRAIRPRWLPPLPYVSYFLEANVRTYVRDSQGRSGVWFYSLDTNRHLAVGIARRFFSLPYFFAAMQFERSVDSAIRYETARAKSGSHSRFDYTPTGPLREAAPDTLEHYLVERYRLFAWREKQQTLLTGEVEHRPYLCQDVALTQFDANLIELAGFDSPMGDPDHVLYSPGVDVDIRAVESAAAREQH